jgi:hypothetical protein
MSLSSFSQRGMILAAGLLALLGAAGAAAQTPAATTLPANLTPEEIARQGPFHMYGDPNQLIRLSGMHLHSYKSLDEAYQAVQTKEGGRPYLVVVTGTDGGTLTSKPTLYRVFRKGCSRSPWLLDSSFTSLVEARLRVTELQKQGTRRVQLVYHYGGR